MLHYSSYYLFLQPQYFTATMKNNSHMQFAPIAGFLSGNCKALCNCLINNEFAAPPRRGISGA